MLCSGLPGPGRITVPFAATLPIPTARHASQRPETRLPRTAADFRTWPRRCAPRFPAAPEIQAPIHRRRSDDFENLSAREQLLQGLVPLPDESRDLFFRACRDRTATTHGLRCMAAPFDRCTAYFGAPFHTHTLGCGQTIVVRLAGTLEAGPGIPRSEYMRRRLMSESGQTRSSGDVGSMSGLPESGHR
jgi:hypothetical protein